MSKNTLRTIASKVRELWKDESAQGATEYILLLVVVVGIAMMFRTKIQGLVKGRLDALGSGMDSFTPDAGQ